MISQSNMTPPSTVQHNYLMQDFMSMIPSQSLLDTAVAAEEKCDRSVTGVRSKVFNSAAAKSRGLCHKGWDVGANGVCKNTSSSHRRIIDFLFLFGRKSIARSYA